MLAESSPNLLKKSSFGSGLSLSRISKVLHTTAIEPSGRIYRRWWFFTTVCALVTSFFTPWEVAFTEDPGLEPYTDGPAVIEYILTFVFIVDIFVQLNVAYIASDGKIVISRRAIATHYLKCMFWIDLIGVIPFNALTSTFIDDDPGTRNKLSLLRLFRLVRTHRLWAFFRDFEMNIQLHLMTITLIRNFVIVLVANHLAACGFYYISRLYDFDEETWIYNNQPLVNVIDLETHSSSLGEFDKYAYSLYWAVTTMTTVGYGDFSPKNVSEVIFVTCFMIFNILLNSYILGTITLIVIKADERTSRQRRGYEKLYRFAHNNRLSWEMQKNLERHLRHNYHHPEIHDSELLGNLPTNLRRKVLAELYSKRLRESLPFKDCSARFVKSLLEHYDEGARQSVSIEVYKTYDEITSKEEYISCLYVLLSGTASVGSYSFKALDVFPVELYTEKVDLNGGDFQIAPYTVKADSICRVMRIPRTTLLRSFRAYPYQMRIFQNAAKEYAEGYLEHVYPLPSLSEESLAEDQPLRKTSTVRFSEDYHNFTPDLEGDEVPTLSLIKDKNQELEPPRSSVASAAGVDDNV